MDEVLDMLKELVVRAKSVTISHAPLAVYQR